MAEALLEVKNLSKSFGALVVTNDVSLRFQAGTLRCIIGPNGAGKTTLFNLITGAIKPDGGRVIFDGEDITNLRPFQISRRGIVRKFQVPTVFEELTVADNLKLAALGYKKLRKLAWSNKAVAMVKDETESIMELIGLSDLNGTLASRLSHGQSQWLEIGMALARRPRLMLLDEPTAGMSPHETITTSQIIRKASQDITTVVIEHDIKFLKEIGREVTVLHKGSILVEGTFKEIENNDLVRDVYLGRRG